MTAETFVEDASAAHPPASAGREEFQLSDGASDEENSSDGVDEEGKDSNPPAPLLAEPSGDPGRAVAPEPAAKVEDEAIAKPEASDGPGPKKKVTLNASHTSYDVIAAAGDGRGWKVIKQEDKAGDCNVHWIDDGTFFDWFRRIEPWMRVNHFPGMNNSLARKTRLARNMQRMQRLFPKEYQFLPPTWVLPDDMFELERRFDENGQSKTIFIVKPDHLCQGRGIFLTTELERIRKAIVEMREKDHTAVVQRYIMKPMLIEGLKFDLRLYFLVAGKITPTGLDLRCFLFTDGLVRLCTTAYTPPTAETMNQRCMHLTNYAINKKSKDFQQNSGDDDGAGSKRSLRWFMQYVEEEYGAKERHKLWLKLMGCCVKTLLVVQPTLEAEYATAFPRDLTGGQLGCRCFEVLGVDVMLDSKRKPYLIEVNHLPSFTCDSPLDEDIKRRVVDQSLDLACSSVCGKDKKSYEQFVRERRDAGLVGPASPSSGAPWPGFVEEGGASQLDVDSYKDFERAYPPPEGAEKLKAQCEAILARVRETFKPLLAAAPRKRSDSKDPVPPQRPPLPPKPPNNNAGANAGYPKSPGQQQQPSQQQTPAKLQKRSASAPAAQPRGSAALPPVVHHLLRSTSPSPRRLARVRSPLSSTTGTAAEGTRGAPRAAVKAPQQPPARVSLPMKSVQILL